MIHNLFLFAGIFPNDCTISENIQIKLIDLLLNGINIYLEGGDIWTNLIQTDLFSLFNLNVENDGEINLNQILGIEGTLTENLSFPTQL